MHPLSMTRSRTPRGSLDLLSLALALALSAFAPLVTFRGDRCGVARAVDRDVHGASFMPEAMVVAGWFLEATHVTITAARERR